MRNLREILQKSLNSAAARSFNCGPKRRRRQRRQRRRRRQQIQIAAMLLLYALCSPLWGSKLVFGAEALKKAKVHFLFLPLWSPPPLHPAPHTLSTLSMLLRRNANCDGDGDGSGGDCSGGSCALKNGWQKRQPTVGMGKSQFWLVQENASQEFLSEGKGEAVSLS
ncbi:GL22858 [Drosophila persimilis]|uniref:GL22858 n=1 Tax=Drosophila persimilis TaxID=7234 RepID=B4GZT3_DROPE|nr:GL22858 [Drosophila persimilis]